MVSGKHLNKYALKGQKANAPCLPAMLFIKSIFCLGNLESIPRRIRAQGGVRTRQDVSLSWAQSHSCSFTH